MVEGRLEQAAVDDEGPRRTTVTLRWRPTPSIVDGRIQLLKALEEQKRLRAFKIGADEAHGLINDDISFSIYADRIFIACIGAPTLNSEFGSFFDTIFSVLKPRTSGLGFDFQHLLRWDCDENYENSLKVAIRKMFNGAILEEFGINDAAILADGEIPGKDLTFQAEYGIVNHNEGKRRLTRPAGRIGMISGFYSEKLEEQVDRLGSIPQISLYVESRWRVHRRFPPDASSEWCLSHIRDGIIEADDFASKMLALISSQDIPQREQG